MRSPVLIIWMLLAAVSSQAQSPNFQIISANTFGGSLGEEFFQASRTSDNGFLITGLSESQDGDINQTIVYDTSNIFIVKCDSLGNKAWAKSYGGNDYDKGRYGIEDSQGNYVITGTTVSKDGQVSSTHNNSEVFVMKLDPLGNVIWLRTYGGNGGESSRFITEDPDGNYLIGAYTTSPGGDVASPNFRGYFDGWIFKTDSAGNILWSKTYGGTQQDRLRFLHPTADGGYVFGGSSTSNDFDCVGNHGDHDFWFGRIDSQGNLLWSRLYGGSGVDWAYHVSLAPDSTWLLSGFTESNDGDVVGYKGGTSDGWVIRVDNNGNLLQQKCLGGSGSDRLYRTLVLGNGEILVAGFAQSNDLDLSGANPGGTNSYWIASLDSTLQWHWSNCQGGSLGDFGKEIYFNESDGSITIMGDSNSPDGPGSTNHGEYDYMFIRMKPIFQPTIFSSGPTTFCSGGSIQLTTLPFPGATYQWKKNGIAIAGATATALTVTTAGNYSIQITQLSGVSATSPNTTVTINAIPTAVISSSGATTLCSGGSVTLSANTGTGLLYQWKRYGVNIAGATNSTILASTTGSYKCVVTNANGCSRSSNTITVTVSSLPTVNITAMGTTQICAGDSVGLSSSTVNGLTYQWKKYANNIVGATSAVYYAKTTGNYKCIVTNTSGCTKSSNTISVNVVCRELDSAVTRDEDESFSLSGVWVKSTNDGLILQGLDQEKWDKTFFQILDLTGRGMRRQQSVNSNILVSKGTLSPGIYIINIANGDEMKSLKVILTD